MRAYPKIVATIYSALVLMLIHQRFYSESTPVAYDRFLHPASRSEQASAAGTTEAEEAATAMASAVSAAVPATQPASSHARVVRWEP